MCFQTIQKYSFHTATFYRYGLTMLILFFYILVFSKFDEFTKTTSLNWTFFLIIAFTTGSGAIFLFYYGLTKIRAIVATICELFFPISAIFFDYLINDNKLSVVQWVAAIIMIGVIINLNRRS
jgi:drug/metabolite transporter (DMT)-like permease